jgi:asparagine synthase (glutamine-hydrolysing)
MASSDEHLAITFDGRIDNRDDLLPILQLPPATPDVRLVLEAYRKWGESCPEKFLGDFAFAVWDAQQQQLFCARDVMGVRPFFYFLNSFLFLASSERRQLFTHPAPTRRPNEPVIAGLLMLRVISQTETIHRDIRRLPPATSMVVTATDVRFRRYWNIHEFAPASHLPKGDEAEEFLYLLEQSVRCRLRSLSPVGILLSGGLDSTAVAAAAVDVHSNSQSRCAFPSYSLGFPGNPIADETELIQETIRYLGLEGSILLPHHREPGADADDVSRYVEFPDFFNDAFLHGIRQRASEIGHRVLLTGMGGDEWFSGSPYSILARLQRGRLAQAFREAAAYAQRRQRSPLRTLWQFGLRPYVPTAIHRLRAKLRPPAPCWAPWINSRFAENTALADRLQAGIGMGRAPIHFPSLALYEGGMLAQSLEWNERSNARFQIEARHPFHDRRLIEFGLTLPPGACWNGHETKLVVRRAGGGRIPDRVCNRSEKAEFSAQMVAELRRNAGPSFFDKSLLADRGWIDRSFVDQMLKETLAQGPHSHYRNDVRLWTIYALELMARNGVI